MSNYDCTACTKLREDAPDFVANGVTEAVCESLADDTGLDASNGNNDATDLHTANDCLIGRMQDEIDSYDLCDWKEFMKLYIGNHYEMDKAIICALGGVWELLHKLIEALGGSGGKIPVMRRYRVTVPASAFGKVWRVTDHVQQNSYPDPEMTEDWYAVDNVTEWFAGSGNNVEIGEFWIKVPLTEMESITGVWTQTFVVPNGNPYDGKGKAYIQTVNVQEWYEQGGYLNVNFDTYELCPPSTAGHTGGPYPVTVDFLVVGARSLT